MTFCSIMIGSVCNFKFGLIRSNRQSYDALSHPFAADMMDSDWILIIEDMKMILTQPQPCMIDNFDVIGSSSES